MAPPLEGTLWRAPPVSGGGLPPHEGGRPSSLGAQDNLCVTALAIYLGGVFGVVHSEQVRGRVSQVATTWLASVALSRVAPACAWSV